MTVCEFKRVKKIKLCRGDLNTVAEIQRRSLDESDFDSSQPVETFVIVTTRRSALETITRGTSGGAKKFQGISIDDSSTHIFWMIYDPSLNIIEKNNFFIVANSKRYRVVSAINVNEENHTLAVQVEDRGPDTEEATKV